MTEILHFVSPHGEVLHFGLQVRLRAESGLGVK
jgi:hypothetical protein